MQHANDNAPLRFLSVCSGIEAASVAWPQWQAVAFSEIEKFPSAVLAHHYPDVPNLGDFTKIDTTKLGHVDILCGGTPCQAFSVAGLRRSLADERGNLSLAFVELAHELAGLGRTNGNGLRNVVWENVVGVLSTKDNAFGCFLAGLVGADAPLVPPSGRKWTRHGMVAGPKGRAAWRVFDAQYFGVAQRRRRVIVVADFGSGADPAKVLLVEEGVRRDTPPRRETGEGTSGAAKGGAGGGGWPADVASTLDTAFGPKQGLDDQHINAGAPYFVLHAVGVHGSISHTLKAEGADASEDSTGRGTPIVAFQSKASATNSMNPSEISPTLDKGKSDGVAICFTAKDYGGDAAYDIAPTLRAGAHSGSHANAGVMPAVTVALRGREGGATAELGGEGATALRASSGGGDKPHVLAFGWQNSEHQGDSVDAHLSPTLDKSKTPAVLQSAVRRLTPVECERLQGFPDNYTAIPWRGKPAEQCPDGPRYKALGNSWAAPLFAWLGRRIDRFMPPVAHNDNKEAARDAAA